MCFSILFNENEIHYETFEIIIVGKKLLVKLSQNMPVEIQLFFFLIIVVSLY